MAKQAGGKGRGRKAKEPTRITNITSTKKVVSDGARDMAKLITQRQAINDQMRAIRAQVEAAGVPKKAFDLAVKMREIEPAERERFDEGFAISREAMGIRVQLDMFADADDDTGDAPPARPEPMFRDDTDADAALALTH